MLDLRGLARFAERHLMPDTVLVTREVGEDVLDPRTGALVPAPPLEVHSGKTGLYGHQERIRSKGGHEGAWVEEVRAGYRLLLPLDAPEMREDDTVKMVEARDKQPVGRIYRVAALGEVSSVPVLRTEHNRRAGA